MNIVDLINSKAPVVLKFGASWCSPCQAMEPIIERLSDKFAGVASVISVDVDDEPELTTKYKIRNVPTILYFKDGELKDKSVGSVTEDELIKRINNLI